MTWPGKEPPRVLVERLTWRREERLDSSSGRGPVRLTAVNVRLVSAVSCPISGPR